MNFNSLKVRLQENAKYRQWFSALGFFLVSSGLLIAWLLIHFKTFAELEKTYVLLITMGVMGLILGGAYLFIITIQVQQEKVKQLRINRHRVRITSQGSFTILMLLIFFIASILSKSNMLLMLFSLMAGLIVINGGMGMMMVKGAAVSRRLTTGVMAGERISINIKFSNTNRMRAAWVMTVRDTIHHHSKTLNAEVLFARIEPGSTATSHYDFRPMQRGLYSFGPLEIITRAPFGMVERGHILDEQDELTVFPRIGQLTSTWKRERSLAAELVQRKQTQKGVFDDEFHAMREYRQGDNPRAIHWRTSARKNELIVREFHQSRDADLMILIDLWLPQSPSDEQLEIVERAISFAATICMEQMRQSRDSRLSLIINGHKLTTWSGNSSPIGIDEMMTILATTRAGCETSLSDWFETACQYRTGSTSLVLLTTRPEAELQSLQMMMETAFEEPVLNSMHVSAASGDFERYYQLPEF